MKHFLSVHDVPHLPSLVQKALDYAANPLLDAGLGRGKRIGLLFLNPSLRTRISTQVAAQNLGMEAIVFNVDKEGWVLEFADGVVMDGTTVEHVKDAAPVLGQYFDVLAVRTFPSLKNREEDYGELVMNQFVQHAGVPVLSLESATLHPLQSLADLVTMEQVLKASGSAARRLKVVLTWAPHIKPLPQCVANSFAQWVNAWGKADFVVTHPAGYELKQEFTQGASIVHDQDTALKDANFVYVKNWSAYEPYGAMLGEHRDWMLTPEKLLVAPSAKVMHCLPVRRNLELSEAVLDGPNSLVTTQAANRVYAAQAVLHSLLTQS